MMSNPTPMARWRHLRGQAEQVWSGLALREKRLLGGAGLVLSALLTWLVLVQPPLNKLAHWQVQTPKLRAQADTLQQLLQALAPAPDAAHNPETALRQSLDQAGLQGRYQLESIAPGGWRLSFAQAPADAVMSWLLGNPLPVSEARLQRVDDATENPSGALSGTVRMDQAPGAKEAS